MQMHIYVLNWHSSHTCKIDTNHHPAGMQLHWLQKLKCQNKVNLLGDSWAQIGSSLGPHYVTCLKQVYIQNAAFFLNYDGSPLLPAWRNCFSCSSSTPTVCHGPTTRGYTADWNHRGRARNDGVFPLWYRLCTVCLCVYFSSWAVETT